MKHIFAGLLIDVGPLRRSMPFRLLYCARLCSLFGYGVLNVAISVQAFEITKSSVTVAMLVAISAMSMAVSLVIGGVLADRWDRRKLILTMRSVNVLAIACLLINTSLETPQVWPMALASFIGGLTGGISLPALSALVPMVLKKGDLAPAAALNTVAIQAGAIAGPLLAGLIIEAGGVFNAYLFVVVGAVATPCILYFLPRFPAPDDATKPSPFRSLLEAVEFVRHSKILLPILMIDFLAMFFAMPFALLPQFADEVLGRGANVIGLLYSAPACGALLAALLSGWTRKTKHPGILIAVAVCVWGLSIVGFSLSVGLAMSCAMLAIAGFADTVSEILRSAILQAETPNHLRGRIFSFWTMQGTSAPALGNLQTSTIGSVIGLRPALSLGGALCVVSSCLVLMRSVSLRRVRLAK